MGHKVIGLRWVSVLGLALSLISVSAHADIQKIPQGEDYIEIVRAAGLIKKIDPQSTVPALILDLLKRERLKIAYPTDGKPFAMGGKSGNTWLMPMGLEPRIVLANNRNNIEFPSRSLMAETIKSSPRLKELAVKNYETARLRLASTLVHEAKHYTMGYMQQRVIGNRDSEKIAYTEESTFLMRAALYYKKIKPDSERLALITEVLAPECQAAYEEYAQ